MVEVIGFIVFTGAFCASASVIAMMVASQWQRIMALASGQPEMAFAPLTQLAVVEGRVAMRRWAARPLPAALNRSHAAA